MKVYLELLKSNSQFRRLWSAQVVSQLGDWFSSIALYTLILSLTGSPKAVGIFLSAQFLPAALVGFWTGPINDRYDRRKLMLFSDLGRGLLTLGFLLVDRLERVWWIYLITFAMVVLRALFEPARKAALPDIVSREDMVRANAISGATWSVMLALGAALGGLVAGLLGTDIAFVLNSLSFFVSALFVYRLSLAPPAGKSQRRAAWSEAFLYLKGHPRVACLAMSKTLWCLGGGITLVLTLYGKNVYSIGKEGAISIGLFYAFRGLGAAFGPFIAYRLKGQDLQSLTLALVPSFFLGGLGYFLLGLSRELWLSLSFVFLAHLGGATQWVFSTSLLQLSVDEKFRGRVFALEFTCLNLAVALSGYLVGWAGDEGFSPAQLAQALAGVFCLSGTVLGGLLYLSRADEVLVNEQEELDGGA